MVFYFMGFVAKAKSCPVDAALVLLHMGSLGCWQLLPAKTPLQFPKAPKCGAALVHMDPGAAQKQGSQLANTTVSAYSVSRHPSWWASQLPGFPVSQYPS